jgi:hypothetical protein
MHRFFPKYSIFIDTQGAHTLLGTVIHFFLGMGCLHSRMDMPCACQCFLVKRIVHMWATATANTDTATAATTAAADATTATATTAATAATATATAVATVQPTDTPAISNTDSPGITLTASNCDNFYCSHLPPTTITATAIGLVE